MIIVLTREMAHQRLRRCNFASTDFQSSFDVERSRRLDHKVILTFCCLNQSRRLDFVMALPVEGKVSPDLVGLRLPSDTLEVTSELTKRFARAVMDKNPKYLGTDESRLVAPPMFGIVVANRILLGAAKNGTLPLSFDRTVHGEHEMQFSSPIAPGDILVSEGQVLHVERRSTGSVIDLEISTKNSKGVECLRQIETIFVRETDSVGTPRQHSAPSGEPVHVSTINVPGDQTFNYAKASFTEGIPAHEDGEHARSLGYQTHFLAGQNTMAFAASAIVDHLAEGDPARLRRLRARFAQVVYPFDTLTTRIWAGDAPGSYVFGTVKHDGTAALINGSAEVSS